MTSLGLVLAAAIALAGCGRDEPRRDPPARVADAADAPMIRVTVDGEEITPLSPATLAGTIPSWRARDRHAWRLGELLGAVHAEPRKRVVARTADGRDHVLRGDGRAGDNVILVQRDDGSLYIGWLVDGAERFGAALGDAEHPATRLEDVVGLTIAEQAHPPDLPPAQVEIERDGVVVRTISVDQFPTLATTSIDNRGNELPAIDLARGLGGRARVAGLVADNLPFDGASPTPDARPLLYLNRRKRFKFAWVDPSGRPLGARLREVTKVILAPP